MILIYPHYLQSKVDYSLSGQYLSVEGVRFQAVKKFNAQERPRDLHGKVPPFLDRGVFKL